MARKLLTQLSYRRGAPYVEAVVGLEAIEKFEEFAPHLVLPDICMPNMDGLTALKRMRVIESAGSYDGLPSYIVAISATREVPPLERDLFDLWLVKGFREASAKALDALCSLTLARWSY